LREGYLDFLRSKRPVIEKTGFNVTPDKLNPTMFKYQADIARWALLLGRAALFLECGMGKTFIQLMWAYLVAQHTGKPTLILAPLAVAHQTVLEAFKFGLSAQYVKRPEDIDSNSQIIVTNYERLHLFDASIFGGVVLDESSILKNLGGKVFWQLVRTFEKHTFKLCCTATPAPNDFVEFSNHSTWLGVMHFKEVLARWFTGDQKLARSAVLKKHAEADWWRWLTSWAVSLSRPGDLGPEYEMLGFDLPPLNIYEHRLGVSQATIDRTWQQGMLLPDTNPNSTTLHKVKRESLDDRVNRAVEIVEALPDGEPCILWCDTNYEADSLKAAFPNAVEVRGSDSVERKETVLNAFSDGSERLLITKPEIAGFGLNWQHCANMVFVGVSFSFERTYQALRRSYRFGQTRPVDAHMIYAETEGNVMNILKEKQKAFGEMQQRMNAAIAEHGLFREDQNPALTSALGRVPIEIPHWLQPQS
jgi:hypothetical protein